jgi:hypothetical protein
MKKITILFLFLILMIQNANAAFFTIKENINETSPGNFTFYDAYQKDWENIIHGIVNTPLQNTAKTVKAVAPNTS